MEKYARAIQATYDKVIRRMRIACWIPKAKCAPSEYVTLTGFQRQQWLRERPLMLRLYVLTLSILLFIRRVCWCVLTVYDDSHIPQVGKLLISLLSIIFARLLSDECPRYLRSCGLRTFWKHKRNLRENNSHVVQTDWVAFNRVTCLRSSFISYATSDSSYTNQYTYIAKHKHKGPFCRIDMRISVILRCITESSLVPVTSRQWVKRLPKSLATRWLLFTSRYSVTLLKIRVFIINAVAPKIDSCFDMTRYIC
jgi:hypothetical protein